MGRRAGTLGGASGVRAARSSQLAAGRGRPCSSCPLAPSHRPPLPGLVLGVCAPRAKLLLAASRDEGPLILLRDPGRSRAVGGTRQPV